MFIQIHMNLRLKYCIIFYCLRFDYIKFLYRSFLMYIHFQITLITLIFFLIIGFIFQKFLKKYNQKFGIIRQKFLKLVNKHLLESYRSFKLIKLNLKKSLSFLINVQIHCTQEILSKMKQDIFQNLPKIWMSL